MQGSITISRFTKIAKRAALALLLCSTTLATLADAQSTSAPQAPAKKTGKGTPLTPTGRTLVAEFSATWCGPCKRFAPTYEKISQAYADRADFQSIDVDAQSDVANYYHVDSVPTVIILDANGKQKWRHTGILTEKQLTDRLDKATGGK